MRKPCFCIWFQDKFCNFHLPWWNFYSWISCYTREQWSSDMTIQQCAKLYTKLLGSMRRHYCLMASTTTSQWRRGAIIVTTGNTTWRRQRHSMMAYWDMLDFKIRFWEGLKMTFIITCQLLLLWVLKTIKNGTLKIHS